MKLNYTVNFDNKEKEEDKGLKNKTKLSMQSTVSSALASKLPSAPAQMPQAPAAGGWGKSN